MERECPFCGLDFDNEAMLDKHLTDGCEMDSSFSDASMDNNHDSDTASDNSPEVSFKPSY